MSIVDIIIFGLLVLGAFSGFKKGLILELLALLAFIIAILGGFYLMHLGVDFLSNQFELNGKFLPILSFFLIFVSIIVLVNFIGKALKKVIDMTPFGSLDNVAGAVLGAVKWAFGLSILLWIISFTGFQSISFLKNSQLIPYLEPVAPVVFEYVSFVIPVVSEIFSSIEDTLQP